MSLNNSKSTYFNLVVGTGSVILLLSGYLLWTLGVFSPVKTTLSVSESPTITIDKGSSDLMFTDIWIISAILVPIIIIWIFLDEAITIFLKNRGKVDMSDKFEFN